VPTSIEEGALHHRASRRPRYTVPVMLLALDVGTKTIGVATATWAVGFVTPQYTLRRQGVHKDVAALRARSLSPEVGAIVVGLPVQDDGQEGRSARLARQVGEALRAATGLPFHYQDESYSTVEAETRLRAAGHDSRSIRELIDHAAAAVILEDWLAENPEEAP